MCKKGHLKIQTKIPNPEGKKVDIVRPLTLAAHSTTFNAQRVPVSGESVCVLCVSLTASAQASGRSECATTK